MELSILAQDMKLPPVKQWKNSLCCACCFIASAWLQDWWWHLGGNGLWFSSRVPSQQSTSASGVDGSMAAASVNSPLPTAAELATLDSLDAVVRWVGLPPRTWQQANVALGSFPNLRILSQAPAEGIAAAIESMELAKLGADGNPIDPPETRELSMVESIQLVLIWRIARQTYGMEDIDVLAPGVVANLGGASPSALATGANAVPLPPGSTLKNLGVQKVKVSQIADQLDETELELVEKSVVDEAFATYRNVMGADPPKESEPSVEQLTVMYNKTVTRGAAPYADFSVLTPYSRRQQKNLKAKGFLLQPDGSWKQSEVPGPPTFAGWEACWEVYRTILLMLKHTPSVPGGVKKPVITWAALDEYHRVIAGLNRQYPEAWHLILMAEDKCRSEQLERTRRMLVRAATEGRLPMGLTFDADQPWVGVFTYIARDHSYWNSEVQVPAQNFIARGGKMMSKREAEMSDLPDAVKEATENKSRAAPGEGQSKAAKKRRKDRERADDEWNKRQAMANVSQWHQTHNSSSSWRGAGGKSDGGAKGKMPHPRKYGQFFVTDRDGNQICYKFAKGQPGACSEPCADQRAHVCQTCLGQHPNVQCPKKKESPGKGK